MQTENRFFDDLARLAGGAMGAVAGLRAEFEGLVRQQFDRTIAGMDLVRREEFDAVQGMAAKARIEQEALEKRVAALEAALDLSRRETKSGA
jgi:BMFP domain-containing protein YqiC